MTKEDFSRIIADLAPSAKYCLSYDMAEHLFWPGVEDDRIKDKLFALAKGAGCVIDHRADQREVWFTKAG